MILLPSMMDQMINQLKLQGLVLKFWSSGEIVVMEIGGVLAFQALEFHYLSNLNQTISFSLVDFLQLSITVIQI